MNQESKESVTYQAMLEEVEKLTKDVANPQLDLDVLVTKVERGYELIKKMRTRLEETRGKIETLRGAFEKNSADLERI